MKVLVLEPFYGGSHRQFLDRWRELSRHELDLLTFSAHHWKWRMRHSAIDFADAVEKKAGGETWDAVFCTDMLNLAECRGLAPVLTRLPTVAYFHENQLTYPVREEKERDHHFAFTNLTTALAADRVWWNSAFHRDDFLSAAEVWLRRLPKPRPLDALDAIRAKSEVLPQGIRSIPGRASPRAPGPLRILWAARWEMDKDPDAFFAVIDALESQGFDYRLSVVGQRFPECPPVFDQARERLAHRIDRWGYQATREDYESCLLEADVFVSTAQHEFFGVAAAEATAAGCYPLLPNRLAYPDLLQALPSEQHGEFLYESNEDLKRRLEGLSARVEPGNVESGNTVWIGDPNRAVRAMEPFYWPRVAARLDMGIESLVRG